VEAALVAELVPAGRDKVVAVVAAVVAPAPPSSRNQTGIRRSGLMRPLKLVLLTFAVSTALLTAQGRKTLDIYSIDVEGGGATLFVPPSGQSLLVDSGNPSNGRDADRIVAAAKDAGLTQIDYLVTTHFHGDHMGGLSELAPRFPIRHYIDHGDNIQPDGSGAKFFAGYLELAGKAQRTSVKVGDKVPIAGLDWLIVASNAQLLQKPLPGAGQPNPACATFPRQVETNFEDSHSVGSLVSFGKFRLVHMGDLTVNFEYELMCPNNRIGTVDAWIVSNHGQVRSGSAVLAHALQPRVAIMNNGVRKGGVPDTMKIIYTIPGLEDLWQAHFSLLGGQEYAAPGAFISNTLDEQPAAVEIAPMPPAAPGTTLPPAPTHSGPAYWIKLSAQQDGSFTVTNSRNGFTKMYRPRTTVQGTR
jgi:beta-lactamase superfamily II metal-dependent hydrolase